MAANASAEPLLFKDYPYLDTVLESLVGNNDVVQAQITRADGRIVSSHPKNGDTVPEQSTRSYVNPIKVYPESKEVIGTVSLAISTQRVDEMSDARIVALIRETFLVFIAISIGLTLILKWIVSDPLVKLGEQARRVGDGNFGQPIVVTTNDELGDLGKILETVRLDLKTSYEQVYAQNLELTEHRNNLQELVDKAVADLKILSGLLPICANCKSIRDASGDWSSLETYIKQNSESEFTHSICPVCIEKYYSDIELNETP